MNGKEVHQIKEIEMNIFKYMNRSAMLENICKRITRLLFLHSGKHVK